MPAFSPICCKADVLLFSSHLTWGLIPQSEPLLSDDPTNAVCSPTVLSSMTWTRNKVILLTYFHLKVRIFIPFFPFARGQIVSSQYGHLQTQTESGC